MIAKRRRARDLRLEKVQQITEWRKDLNAEAEFEHNLAKEIKSDGISMEKVYKPHVHDWGKHFLLVRLEIRAQC